jgi:hypothetical protein
MLVDPRTIYVAIDQTGLLIVSRFDAGVTIPAGLVVIQGLGPN